jgi:hypothetical protein
MSSIARLLVACAVIAAGCSSSASPSDADDTGAVVSQLGTSGALRFEIVAEQPVTLGVNRFRVRVSDASSGVELVAPQLVVTTRMASMGHGSSVTPVITMNDDGSFEVERLALEMPGTWDVRFAVMATGVSDATTADYDVR